MPENLESQLAKKEREIATVIAISHITSQNMPLPVMLDRVSAEIALLLNAPFCAILIQSKPSGALRITGSFGLSAAYIDVINRQADQYDWMSALPSGKAIRAAQPLVWDDVSEAPEFADFREAVLKQGYVTMISAPMRAGEKQIGTINCYYTSRYTFSEAELSLVSMLANHTAAVIRNKQLLDALNQSVSELSSLNQQLDTQRELLLQSEAIHKQLTHLVIEEKGITAVVRTTAQLLNRPIALFDASFQIIASSTSHSPPIPKPELRSLPDYEKQRPSLLNPLRVSINQTQFFFIPLIARQRTVGYVGVLDGTPLSTELEQRALEHAATVCTLELVKQRIALDTSRRMRGDFIDDMLLGRFTDEAELRRRAAYFKFTFKGDFRVLVVDIHDFSHFIAKHNLSETQVEDVKHTVATTIEQCCQELKKATFVAPQGDRAVVLWPMRHPQTLTRLKYFSHTLSERMLTHWPGLLLTVSVSTPIANPLRFSEAYRECLDALAIVKRFGRTSPIVVFDELGIYTLLLRNNAVADLQEFAKRKLEPILTHERGEDLLNTLIISLQHQFSPQKSAEILMVHPNTIKYRLNQLKELLNADFNNAEHVLELQLALSIQSLIPSDK